MPNNYQFNVNQIEPGTQIFVTGTTTFSRIAKLVEGKQLEEENQRRIAKGWSPYNGPYSSLTIEDAQIIPQNQGQLSLAEQYIQERFYTGKSGQSQGKYCYTGKSNNRLPHVFERTQTSIREVKPERELANGLKATLVLNCYKTKMSNGIGLEAVIIDEPIQYYEGGSSAMKDAISKMFNLPVETLPPEVPTVDTEDVPNFVASTIPPQTMAQPTQPTTVAAPPQPTYTAPVATPPVNPQVPQTVGGIAPNPAIGTGGIPFNNSDFL